MLRIGARIVANSPFRKKGGDALRGTQLLLTKTGRDELFAAYKEAFAGGADAVCTSLDTSIDHLNRANFYSDMSRDNDMSYYVVGKGNGPGGYELQGRGYTFCIPREMVAMGEKRDFAGLLCEQATNMAQKARDAALEAAPLLPGETTPLVGTTIRFTTQQDGTPVGEKGVKDGTLHLGYRMEHQIVSAATASTDFFAIVGCETASDVDFVSGLLEKNKETTERRYSTNLKGMPELDDEPTTKGFNIPALILASSPPCEQFTEVVKAAARSPHICGVASPTQLDEGDLDELQALLREDMILVGSSEAAGELAVRGGGRDA